MEGNGSVGPMRERPPRMADVAAHAGVSQQTVSRVLNNSDAVRAETRSRVLSAIQELGYRRNSAARVLATNRSERIGLISAYLPLYGPRAISAAVQNAAHDSGYGFALVGLGEISRDSLSEAVDRLLDQAVEAVIVAVTQRDALDTVADLDLPVPVVVVQGVDADQPLAAGIDQVAGAQIATNHLLELGHTCVAHVSGPLDWIEAEQRRQGWRSACDHAGAERGPEFIGDWSAESGYMAGRELLRHPSVTSVFVANDTMAVGVLHAIHEHGRRVPEEISVVGFDDVPEAARYWPSLTTVHQPFELLGQRAVDLAVRALNGGTDIVTDLVEPHLVLRTSTMAPTSPGSPGHT